MSSTTTDPIDQHRRFLHTISARRARRRRLVDPSNSTSTSFSTSSIKPHNPATRPTQKLINLVPGEETVRNDLSVRYIVSGEWAGNRITGVSVEDECREYPKLRHLLDLKQALISTHAHPPLYITLDPLTHSPRSLTTLLHPHIFDVILLRPPPSYSWAEITAIPVRLISGDPSFVFLWVGKSDGEGLERGREALLKWGFRRCEEIVWVKRNTRRVVGSGSRGRAEVGGGMTVGDDAMNADVQEDGMPTNVLVNQKEHCLVGIRGTVRRKTDNWFVHCNVDTDVIVYEPDLDDLDDPDVNPAYPPQIHTIIENFCLGARRLELFAPRSQARRGWVTVGPDELEPDADGAVGADDVQAFDSARYGNYQESNKDEMGRYVLPLTQEIDHLRPKSPVRGERGAGGDTFHLPRRPGHVDGSGTVRGRQGGYSSHQQGHQQQQQQRSQGMLSPVPMSTSNHSTMPSLPVTGMQSNPAANQNPMNMMNAMNMMGMGMNGMPMMGGMGMGMGNMGNMGNMGMGMGFPMMNMNMGMGMGMMPFGNMNMGMGGMGMMNPMMQGMFGGGQAGNSGNNTQQSPAQGQGSPLGTQPPGSQQA